MVQIRGIFDLALVRDQLGDIQYDFAHQHRLASLDSGDRQRVAKSARLYCFVSLSFVHCAAIGY